MTAGASFGAMLSTYFLDHGSLLSFRWAASWPSPKMKIENSFLVVRRRNPDRLEQAHLLDRLGQFLTLAAVGLRWLGFTRTADTAIVQWPRRLHLQGFHADPGCDHTSLVIIGEALDHANRGEDFANPEGQSGRAPGRMLAYTRYVHFYAELIQFNSQTGN